MIALLILLVTQDLYWYEHYEEAEKAFKRADYTLCLSHLDAAIAVKPTSKKAEIIRAGQKLEYKPHYYKALALFKLGHIDEAVVAAGIAAQGEVVKNSFALQNELFPILREYSRRIQTYRQEIHKEQQIINARREVLELIGAGDLEGARQAIGAARADDQERFNDIVYLLNMIDTVDQQSSNTRNQALSRIERYLFDKQPESAQALFLALQETLPADQANELNKRINLAIEAKQASQLTTQEDPQEQARLQDQLDQGLDEIRGLMEQRELMRASLDALANQNERLQRELTSQINEGNPLPGPPTAVLQVIKTGLRAIRVEARFAVPSGLADWSVASDSLILENKNPEVVSPSPDNFVYVKEFLDVPFGDHLVTLSVRDQLGRTESTQTTVSLPKPIYLKPPFWIISAILALAGTLSRWLKTQRARRHALMKHFNPYIAGSPVRKSDMFYGRDALVERIVGLVHKNSLMIYGERRIGKTSLLFQIKNRLAAVESDQYAFIPCYVDLQGVKEEDLFHQIMADILLEHPEYGSHLELDFTEENEGYRSRQFSRDIKRIIEWAQQQDQRHLVMVLLMDEVDVINEFSEKTNQKLRGIFMKEFAEHLSCVMAGIHLKKEWESSGSPWYNFFEEIPMTYFDEEAAKELILDPVKGIFSFDRDAVTLIMTTTGGQPYLIQKICVSLINHKLSEHHFRIGKDDVTRTLEQMRDEMKLIQGVAT
ncbi:MAG: AAA family ATPase [Acidobacteria bacterium]|nr:AAA family ATPase [Acidobacteriota bacterium]